MKPILMLFVAALGAALTAPPATAEMIGGNPGPQHNYVCPHAEGLAPLDCYFDAVQHLYTMCRNVKAIEILEFGYEKSQEGVNAAKSEYCLDKQKLNITRPYQAALREAAISKQAVEDLRSLQELWLNALAKLKWIVGESDEDYKTRVAKVYDEFKERIDGIRKIVLVVREHTTPAAASTKVAAKPAAKSAPKATAKATTN